MMMQQLKRQPGFRERNKVRISTAVNKKDVRFMDEYPADDCSEHRELRKVYKFYCPICLRYFNHMLVSSCCNNYICRLCIGWQANKAKRDPEYTIQCSHCYTDSFKLTDVNSDDPNSIKWYTDTPMRCQLRSEAKQRQLNHLSKSAASSPSERCFQLIDELVPPSVFALQANLECSSKQSDLRLRRCDTIPVPRAAGDNSQSPLVYNRRVSINLSNRFMN
jgi:hypothetical protein